MRTTIAVADDVYAEMERLRREEGLGPSQALNYLARRGMGRREESADYVHAAAPLGLSVDVANIADVLDLLDEHDSPA